MHSSRTSRRFLWFPKRQTGIVWTGNSKLARDESTSNRRADSSRSCRDDRVSADRPDGGVGRHGYATGSEVHDAPPTVVLRIRLPPTAQAVVSDEAATPVKAAWAPKGCVWVVQMAPPSVVFRI